jgi:hypothetical protein
MPTYINSKNEEVDTSTLAQPHLERALAKAQREGNDENIQALQQELTNRGQATDSTDDITIDTETTDDTISS